MSDRLSATSVLDVSSLEPYYNRLDVFVAFTDTGAFDLYGGVDENNRPRGVFSYPVNDVVGRKSRENSLYGRVFRYSLKDHDELDVFQYTNDKFDRDTEKLKEFFPNLEDFIDEQYMLIPGKIRKDTPFGRIWMLTYYVGMKISDSRSEIRDQWAFAFRVLGYNAIFDNRGSGIIDQGNNNAVLLVIDNIQTDIEDLEIVSTQESKKEINQRIATTIERFNSRTDVSNARNRIKKY